MTWKRLTTRTVYENDWITVLEDDVINPNGGHNRYGHVHFKNRAIGIVPLSAEGDTWLVGQQRYTLGEWSWEIPMGGCSGDDPLEAARRELREETGLTARRWQEVMRLHTSNSITDESGFVFLAEELTPGEPDFDETEKLAIRRLPLGDAVRMVLAGEITDAISAAGLLRVWLGRQPSALP